LPVKRKNGNGGASDAGRRSVTGKAFAVAQIKSVSASLNLQAVNTAYSATCKMLRRRAAPIPPTFSSDIRRWAAIVDEFAGPATEADGSIENEAELIAGLILAGPVRWSRERRNPQKRKSNRQFGRPRNVLECDAALYLAVLFREYFRRRPTHGPFKKFGEAVFRAAGWKKPPTAALREAIERWETSYHFDKHAVRQHLFGYRIGRQFSTARR
jgi:hypothetical protein